MKLEIPPGDFAGHIFDCDGTIVDSMPLHYRAWIAALEIHQARFEFTEEYFYASAGVEEAEITRRLNRQHGTKLDPEAVLASKQQWLLQHVSELKTVPAIESIVRSVAAAGKAMAVASGSELCIVEPELEAVGLRDFFSIIVTPEFVARGKPAPDMFLLAARKMSVGPEACLVYEDGQSGIEAARAAGMASVFVSR